jgi:HTH-type transcriptional regulator/antitoxin HipB
MADAAFPISFPTQLRQHLRALRKQRGLTQAQLGALMGVSQARIAEIEAKPGLVNSEQLMKLLAILGATLMLRPATPPSLPASTETKPTRTPPKANLTPKVTPAPVPTRADVRPQKDGRVSVLSQRKAAKDIDPTASPPNPSHATTPSALAPRPKKGAW